MCPGHEHSAPRCDGGDFRGHSADSPQVGLYVAVTPKDRCGHVRAEALTMEEVIRVHTQTCAWLLFKQDVEVEQSWRTVGCLEYLEYMLQ